MKDIETYQSIDPDDPSTTSVTQEDLIAVMRLTRDQQKAAKLLNRAEAKYLVDMYYNLQEQRIRANAQVNSAQEEPNELISWMYELYKTLEGDMKHALGKYAEGSEVGQWALSVTGIGPVIAAGLLCHIDVDIAKTSGDVWRYAGYDPTSKWLGREGSEKLVASIVGKATLLTHEEIQQITLASARNAETFLSHLKLKDEKAKRSDVIALLSKRPWNASLKRLGWLIGQSFVKSSNRESSYYGPLFKNRKMYESSRNERFLYRDQAEAMLQSKKFVNETIAKTFYEMGMLPPAHIQRRCERWTVKIFLSHYFQVAFETKHHLPVEKPWIMLTQPTVHTHYIPAPNYTPLTAGD